MRKDRRIKRIACTAALTAAGFSQLAYAQDFTWNVNNGTFNVAGNWTPAGGPPNAATDGAIFNSASTYTVTFNNSPSIGSLLFNTSNATFVSSGSSRTLSLANSLNVSSGNLTISSLTLDAVTAASFRGLSTMTVRDAGLFQAPGFNLGNVEAASILINGSALNATGVVNIGLSGADGSLVFSNNSVGTFTGLLALAPSGVANSGGTVLVQSGSDVSATNVRIATNGLSGQSGLLQVTGAGSSFSQSGASTLSIGTTANSFGTLQIDTNGLFSSGTGSINIGATGALIIDSGGLFDANGDLFVNGILSQLNSSTFLLASGKSLTVSGASGAATLGSSFNLFTSQTLSVLSGGIFTENSFLDLGNGGAGTLIVDGAGSRFRSQSISFVGSGTLGAATITINNGASASFSAIDAGRSGGVATITINGGTFITGGISTFNTGALVKLQAGTFAPTGTLNIAGTFNQTGGVFTPPANRPMTVTGTANLTSNLSLSGNHTLSISGTGVLTSSGSVDIGSGAANGSVLLSGTSPRFTQTGAAPLAIGGAAGGAGSLTINAGTYQMGTGTVTVGASGKLLINGGAFRTGGTLIASPGAVVALGGGTLDLLNYTGSGTTFAHLDGTLRLGAGNPTLPLNLFDGPVGAIGEMNGTTFSSGGSVVIGQNLIGTLRLQSNASFQYSTVTLGQLAGSKGTLELNSASSLRGTFLDIGYGTTGTDGGAGTVIVQGNASLQVGGNLRVGSHGTLNLVGTAGFNGGNAVNDFIRGGRVTVDPNTPLVIANDGGPLSSNPLGLSIYSDAGGSPASSPLASFLTIESGGVLTTPLATVAGNSNRSANVTVVGANANWHNTGDATIGFGDATLAALSGGRIDIDGTLHFQSGGVMNINNGTINVGAISQFGSGTPMSLYLNQAGFHVTNGGLSVGTIAMIDRLLTVPFASSVSATGPLTISAGGVLSMEGGTLTVPSVINQTNNALNIGFGTLILTSSGSVGIGGSGSLGPAMTIGSLGFVSLGGSLNVSGSTAGLFGLGGTLNAVGGFINSGSVLVLGGRMSFAGNSLNLPAGQINVINGRMSFPGDGISNDTGLVNLTTLNLTNAIIDGDVRSPAGSTINVGAGVTFNGLVSGAASFPGAGIVTFNGGYSPGDSPAAVTFNGPITFGPSNHLKIELGGTTPGSQFDKVTVTGLASLDGIVDISLINGFVALPGNQFEILDFGSRSGDVTIANTSAFPGLNFNKLYTPTSLTLVASALGGDANLDAKVDIKDLLALALHYNAGGNWLAGDFNASGIIDKTDLTILAQHWQAGVGAPALPALLESLGLPDVPVAVPEPTSFAFLALAGAMALRRRTR